MSEEGPKSEQTAARPTRRPRRPGVRKAIDALVTLSTAGFVTIEDISEYYEEIARDRNDRSVAILLGTTVENVLRSAIERVMRTDPNVQSELFDSDRPLLGTFAAKIMMANSLNIFGNETRDNLDLIRNIRNTFAHTNLAIDFETKEVKKACELLHVPARIPILGLYPMPRLMSLLADPHLLHGRRKYEATCHYLSHNFVAWMSAGARSVPSADLTNPPPSNYEVWAIERPLP